MNNNAIHIPPALVLGCNTPHGIGVLSDWIEEQTGFPLDLDQSGWSDKNGIGAGYGYGRPNINSGYGNGCGYGFDRSYYCDGDGYGSGDCYGFFSSYGSLCGDGRGWGYLSDNSFYIF